LIKGGSMIKKLLYIVLWSILCVLAGIAIACLKCQPELQKATVKIEGVKLKTVISMVKATQKLLDTDAWPKHYVIRTLYDTIPIDSAMPYGDVPVTETSWDTSLVMKINDTTKRVDITLSVTHKGEIFEHTIYFHPLEFTIDVPGPKTLRPWGNVGIGYVNGGKVPAAAEVGLLYKSRISLSGIIIHIDDWHYGGMLRVWF
jgi:hypothetical protein